MKSKENRSKNFKKKNKVLKKRRIRKRKMNQKNSLMKISNDNISQIISFLKSKEIMNIRTVNKNFKFVVDKYKLEKVAIKYFFDSSYPRLYEAWSFTYDKQYNLKDMKAFLNKYKNDKNNFQRDALKVMLEYQSNMIMEKKPLVLGIYNTAFELCNQRQDIGNDNCVFCYETVVKILINSIKVLKVKFNKKFTPSIYEEEKLKYRKMTIWLFKTTSYLSRYFISNSEDIVPIKNVAKHLFETQIIQHFGIPDDNFYIEEPTQPMINIQNLVNNFLI